MSAPILQVWSAPKCQADAVPIAALPAITSAQITETINGADSGTITLPAAIAQASGLAEGHIIRAILPLRGVIEWVVTAIRDSDPASTVSVTLGPLRHLLALRGFVREESAATVSVALTPNLLTVADLLRRYVLTNLDADGLTWLALGTIEYTALIDPGQLVSVRRGEVLALIERITGYEVALRRMDNDTGYAIDVLERRGEALPTLLMEPPIASGISRVRDLTVAATAVMPIGTDGRPMGEIDWTGGAALGAGPYWIPLTDPAGGAAPIREDHQFSGLFLRLADGTSLAITDTRASDSAVRVASLGTYATGQRVILCESAAGRPVSLITSPSALAQSRGLIVAKVTAKGARAERTLNRNAGFEDGATYATEVNGTGQRVAIPRSEMGLAYTFAANGARAGGTSTATPLAVDGLPASAWVRRGDVIEHAAATRDITTTVQSSTTGTLALTLAAPGLPSATVDGFTVSLTRRFAVSAVSAIGMPRLGGIVYLTDASVGTATLSLMLGERRMTEPTGSYVFSGPNGYALNLYPAAQDATRMAVQCVVTTTDPLAEAVAYTRHVTAITATGAQEITLTFGSDVNTGSTSVGQWVLIDATAGANWGAIGMSQAQAPYLWFNGDFRLIGQVASVSGSDMVVDLVGYPSGVDFRSAGTITPKALALNPDVLGTPYAVPVVYGLTNVWASASTFVLSTPERPPVAVQLDGVYASGVTSVTTKPNSAIATRAWQNGDVISYDTGLPSVTFTAAIASYTGMVATITPSGSNVQSYTVTELQQVRWAIACAFTYDVWRYSTSSYIATAQNEPSLALDCVFASRSGNAYTFTPPTTYDPPSDADLRWDLSAVVIASTDTLSEVRAGGVIAIPVTGAATFNTATGVAAVPVALVEGYTLPRGALVWANWHGSAGNSSLRIATAATGPISSLDVYGGDEGTVAAFRVHGGTGLSSVAFPGNTMVAAADAQANGSGQASVTLMTAPPADIADNAVLSLTRPVLFGPRDDTAGSALRLLSAAGSGTPAIGVAATQLESVSVPVTAGDSVPVIAVARFRVTPESLAVGQAPAVAIVDVTAGAVLAHGTIGGTTIYLSPYGEVEIKATATLTASAVLAVRIYGGSSADFSRWHLCTDASLYVGSDVLPYVAGARSRVAFQRGQDVLAQRKNAARYTVRGIDTAALSATGTPVQIGQRVRLRSAALSLDTTERIVGLTWRWPGAELVEMECAALAPRLTDVEVSA